MTDSNPRLAGAGIEPPAKYHIIPVGLVLFFIVFISYIAWFIHFASRQKMDLVREDYYDQEIKFQKQIDGLKRAQMAGAPVSFHYDPATMLISVGLPAEHAAKHPGGSIILYRPSDAAMDVKVPLTLDPDGSQRLDAKNLRPGLWKIRVEWRADDKDFFSEQPIVLGPGATNP